MSLIQKWEKLKDLVMSMEGDVTKVEQKAVKASAKRARKILQEVKSTSQELRKELQDSVS